MAEGTQSPVGTQSPSSVALPKTQDERTTDLEDAINGIHVSFKQEIDGHPCCHANHGCCTLHTAKLYAGNNLLWMASFTSTIKVLFVAYVSIKIYTSVPKVGEKTILGSTNWD